MAGSINHITDENGKFTMKYIENLGDAHEALEECFNEIQRLKKICQEFIWAEENPVEYKTEMTRLREENRSLKLIIGEQ